MRLMVTIVPKPNLVKWFKKCYSKTSHQTATITRNQTFMLFEVCMGKNLSTGIA